MRKANLLIILQLFICYLPVSAMAASEARELSLSEACRIALESSPLIQQAEAARNAAGAEVDRAVSAFLPKLDVEVGYSHSNKPPKVFSDKLNQQEFATSDFAIDRLNDPGYRDNWGAKFIFTQPLFNQGREYTGYKIARHKKEMASIQLDGARQGLLYMVEKAYFQTLLAENRIEVLQKALETAKKNEALAEARHKTGMALKSDVLNMAVHKTETERELIQAENNYMVAMASLNKIMGHSMDAIWKLRDEEPAQQHAATDVACWINLAKKRRADLLAAQKQLETAHDRTRQAKFTFLPSVNLHAIYDNNRHNIAHSGGDDWTIMASASFNIFNGLGDRAAVASATAREKEAEAALKEAGTKTELEVRKAFYNLQNRIKQLEVMEKSVAQAEESLRIIARRYSNGLALIVELLSADTVLKKEKLREARARFDVRLAWSGLRWSAGVLGAENAPPDICSTSLAEPGLHNSEPER